MPHEFRELGMANSSIGCTKSVQKHPWVHSGQRVCVCGGVAYEGGHKGIKPLALLWVCGMVHLASHGGQESCGAQ